MNSTVSEYTKMISDGYIAFHYEYDLKNKSKPRTFEPSDYQKKSNQDLFKRLIKICNSGALIGADFSKYHTQGIPSLMVMGVIPKNSKPEETITFREYIYKEDIDWYDLPYGTYKIIRLQNPVIFLYGDYPELQTLQAGKRGNLNQWKKGTSIEQYIKNLYKFRLGIIDSIAGNPYSILPSQLEVLCLEYLRLFAPKQYKLNYLLSPIGRGKKDVDIDGISNDNRILAQVSMSNDLKIIEEKINVLLAYSESINTGKHALFVYFGPLSNKKRISRQYQNLIYIDIEDVYEKMKSTGLIDYMIHGRAQLF